MRKLFLIAMVTACGLALASCDPGHPPPKSNYGAHPELPAPAPQTLPTMSVNSVTPWPEGTTPIAPTGFTVTRFAGAFDHPRWIYVLPNGDVLVAETSSEPPPLNSVESVVERWLDSKSHAAGKSANEIILLRDTNGDGKPD